MGLEFPQIGRGKGNMLTAELLRIDHGLLLLERETAHSIAQPCECLFIAHKSFLSELEEAAERLWEVGGAEDVCCLHLRLIAHDLADQVLVNLAEGAVQHLATLEHVEDAVGEDRLVVAHPIDIEHKLIRCQA